MNKIYALLLMLFVAISVNAQRKTCIDRDWMFLLGDGSEAINNPDVTDNWRTLNLPHDWSVETEAAQKAGGTVVGPFSTNSIGKYQTANTVGGIGWYCKRLNVNKNSNDRYTLYFEGAYNQSDVYLNGRKVYFNSYGYSSFRFDVTDELQDGENILLVRVANEGNNTRWYAGSGIYRHVWLIHTPSLHSDEWDLCLRPSTESLMMETIVYNDDDDNKSCTVQLDVLDADDNLVGTTSTDVNVDSWDDATVSLSLNMSNPKLWSPESPYLYKAVVKTIDENAGTSDVIVKRFGVRTIAYSAEDGFLLNGKNILLQGGCMHHDNGLLGAAAFDKAETRKLTLLKEQGFNAVRCSHNLPSEHYLDVCDSIGLMVVDEMFDQWINQKNTDDYHNFFPEFSDRDYSTMMRRDRNHPAIIMWSIGNEIPGRINSEGLQVAERLRKITKHYDEERAVTAAVCGWDDGWSGWDDQDNKAFISLDIGGYNYMYEQYEHDHSTHPDRVMVGLESYPKLASENWTLVEKHPYVIGDFVWTAMDYVGEAGIGCASSTGPIGAFQQWPWFNGYCGDIDLIGQKKPQSYYRDVVWRQAPITMAVQPTASWNSIWGWQLEEQSWTWPEYEGQNVTINVYSRASKVRLYLNGEVKGEASPGSTFWAGFYIPYEPGTLRVVNLDNNDNEIEGEEFVLKTTGVATGVRFVYEDKTLSADTNDLAYVTIEVVDDEGNVVTSDCETKLTIANTGAGDLIACGTANPTDMNSFRSNTLTVFRGRALAILRGNGTAGTVSISAEMQKPAEAYKLGVNISSGISGGDGGNKFDTWELTSDNDAVGVSNFQTHDFATTQADYTSTITWWGQNRGTGCIVSDKVDHKGSYSFDMTVEAGKSVRLTHLYSDVLMDDDQLSLYIGITNSSNENIYTSSTQNASSWRNTLDTDIDVTLPEGTYTVTAYLSNMSNGKYYIGALQLTSETETNNTVPTVLLDEESEDSPTAYPCANVTLQRTLKAGIWNSICLPFPLEIPDGWSVKELTEATIDGDNITLAFNDASDIVAGMPYMVRVENAVESISAEQVPIIDNPSATTINGIISFNGNFGKLPDPGIPTGSYFIKNNNFYVVEENAPVALKGYRAFLTPDNDNGVKLITTNLDGTADAIQETEFGERNCSNSQAIYDLAGHKIECGESASGDNDILKQLPKGLYIVNREKIVVR